MKTEGSDFMPYSNTEFSKLYEAHLNNIEDDAIKSEVPIMIWLLDNCNIEIPKTSRFFCKVDIDDIRHETIKNRRIKVSRDAMETELYKNTETLAYTATHDFGHTSAAWESVISLGIFGLRNRIAEYSQKNTNPTSREFYSALISVYDAALRFILRVADKASSVGREDMADGLRALATRQPETLSEAMQTSIIYYTLQHFFDGSPLRTLGRLDKLFYPYYLKEDKDEAISLLRDYMSEIDDLEADANIPFALGGTDVEGNSSVNELSYLFLDIYGEIATRNTKMHLLVADSTPRDIIEKAFRLVRSGHNSIVFMSDKKIIEALIKQGAEPLDAARYHVVGCYECGAEGELTCSCNARVNIPKALELALFDGIDILSDRKIGLSPERALLTFEDVVYEFERQLKHLASCAMRLTDLYEEKYSKIHCAPFLSGTYVSALEKGGDLYGLYSAKYNNSSLNAVGLATATDSLAAIRKAVFEDKIITLERFKEILRTDYEGEEYLRLLIKNKYPKYGRGDERTDSIARDIVNTLASAVSRKPNAKGGNYRLGIFSINWRWSIGAKTAASADGRHAGETLSQNASANFGQDTEGATMHLLSASRIDTTNTPNGTIVDIDLHSSAVSGDNGIKALATSLKTYFDLGGFAVHYNVLDTNILNDAKLHPEKYPNLQVRLCGWNVLFSSLSEKEKDEFIARAIR